MQSHSFYGNGKAIIAIARIVSAVAAAACFAWLLLLVMASALRSPQRTTQNGSLRPPDDRLGHEMPGHPDGCDCPRCERELFTSQILGGAE